MVNHAGRTSFPADGTDGTNHDSLVANRGERLGHDPPNVRRSRARHDRCSHANMPSFTKRKPGLLLAIAAGAATVVACGGSESSRVMGSIPEQAPDGSVPDGGCAPYDCCNQVCGTAPYHPPDSGPVGIIIEPGDAGRPDALPVGIVLPPSDLDGGADATVDAEPGLDGGPNSVADAATDADASP